MAHAAHRRLAQVVDHQAADCDFCSDVEENANGAEAKVAKVPGASVANGDLFPGFDQVGQVDEVCDDRHQEGQTGEDHVWHSHGRGELRRARACGHEDEGCSYLRSSPASEGVGEAAEVEAGGGRFGSSERADIRIDRDLQERETTANDEEGEEEERIEDDNRGRKEEKQSEAHDRERDDDASFVADLAYDPAGRQRHDEVGAEEAELDEKRGDVGEVKEVLEVRNEDVVERGDEANTEVERDHQRQRNGVAFPGGLNCSNRTFPCDSKCHFVPRMSVTLTKLLRSRCSEQLTCKSRYCG